jgi:hypothetical protein
MTETLQIAFLPQRQPPVRGDCERLHRDVTFAVTVVPPRDQAGPGNRRSMGLAHMREACQAPAGIPDFIRSRPP